jgi:vacuolar iron transporter family protein
MIALIILKKKILISLKNIQTEIDASFLYKLLSEHESDANVAKVFAQMSDIENGHAVAFMTKNKMDITNMPPPTIRAKVLAMIGKIFGYDYLLGVLLDTEKSIASGVLKLRNETNTQASISDTAHVTILKNILNNNHDIGANQLARFEKRHRSVGGNALRAAVLGGNDGLVSNFSLIMGIAGATASAANGGQKEILLTGLAGMLAGALSMALGEWISVKSSNELYENQMQLEMEELETNPEGEEKELALIYYSKGIPEAQAKQMAAEIMLDKQKAHQILIKEELGINPEDLQGSAMEAALTSFFLFAIGAVIPVMPFFFTSGYTAIICSAICSAFGLFVIGAAITLFTGKSVWFSGMRQVVFGLMAAAVTYGIGRLIGVAVG